MIKFYLDRLFSNSEETIGVWSYEKKKLCWSLEDELRAIKVYKETRIPAGEYKLVLRTFGGHHERYKDKFPEIHKGMIQLLNVPHFTDILIHIGNTEKDTAGCLLVGSLAAIETNRYTLVNSTKAYKYIYPLIANPLYAGEEVTLKITDETREIIG